MSEVVWKPVTAPAAIVLMLRRQAADEGAGWSRRTVQNESGRSEERPLMKTREVDE